MRDGTKEILREAQRRVPAGQRFVQEAFTTEHRRPVLAKLHDLRPDTFYFFDEMTACALCEAVVEWAARHGGGQLTVSSAGPRHITGKFSTVRVGTGRVLSKYRFALREGRLPVLFIGRASSRGRYLGFLTCHAETVDEVAGDVDLAARGLARRLATFERLQMLHQTTQRVTRELESYSRRMELAIRRAQRRPDLLTPARFDRIVRQSIVKIEQLKEIPRRALRTLG